MNKFLLFFLCTLWFLAVIAAAGTGSLFQRAQDSGVPINAQSIPANDTAAQGGGAVAMGQSQVVTPAPTVSGFLEQGEGSAMEDDSAMAAMPADGSMARPEPTTASVFGRDEEFVLAATPTPIRVQEARNPLNLGPLMLGQENGTGAPDYFNEIIIYDEKLDPSWTLDNSVEMRVDMLSPQRWFEVYEPGLDVNSGAVSLAFQPKADNAKLYFTVKPERQRSYTRDDVEGISFWLHTGTDILDIGDISVSVIGSNAQPYWSANDNSVFLDSEDTFSESTLEALKINRAIDRESWVQIIVWFDELQYDPDYTYVTGFYIESDIEFRNRIYIDRVALLSAQ